MEIENEVSNKNHSKVLRSYLFTVTNKEEQWSLQQPPVFNFPSNNLSYKRGARTASTNNISPGKCGSTPGGNGKFQSVFPEYGKNSPKHGRKSPGKNSPKKENLREQQGGSCPSGGSYGRDSDIVGSLMELGISMINSRF